MNKRIISAIMAAAVAFSAVPFYSVNPVQDYAVTASADGLHRENVKKIIITR